MLLPQKQRESVHFPFAFSGNKSIIFAFHKAGSARKERIKTMDVKESKQIKALAAKIRIGLLEAIHSVGSGHVGGSMSIADVLAVLYGREMRYDPKNPAWPERDKLVTSKGHCGPAVYATLAIKGFFPYEELKTMNKPGTRLPSHTDMNKTPGIDMTTGSLGQGTSLAAGLALGEKLRGRDGRVFLIVGDGESNEGQCWEAFSFAAAKKLSNLVVLLDWNKRQLDGFTDECLPFGDYVAKFESFGFDTVKVNGNDVDELAAALEKTRKGGDKPYAIVMDTVKGAGIKEIEDIAMNHSIGVDDEQFARWTAQLQAEIKELEA